MLVSSRLILERPAEYWDSFFLLFQIFVDPQKTSNAVVLNIQSDNKNKKFIDLIGKIKPIHGD
jgi:hypothetical protein